MPTRSLVTSYQQDLRRFPDRWHMVGLSLLTLLLIIFPLVANSYWLGLANQTLVYIIGAIGLMILTGFAGQISLGHAAFIAIGAYTTAILAKHFGCPFWLAIPASGLAAAALGLLVGPFALRLRGLYLAIVTLGLLFIVNHILLSFPEWTGGSNYIQVPLHSGLAENPQAHSYGDMISDTKFLGFLFTKDHKLYVISLIPAILTVFLCSNIRRSRLGRSMMAVRDSDLAAMAIGINPAHAKITAFGISSFLAGIAGSLFALQLQIITVNPPFDLNMSVQYIAIIVLGGIGSTFGAVAGSIIFVCLQPITEFIGEHIPFVNSLSETQQSTFIFSILVIMVLLFEPLGLYGVWLRVKRYFLTWPFRY